MINGSSNIFGKPGLTENNTPSEKPDKVALVIGHDPKVSFLLGLYLLGTDHRVISIATGNSEHEYGTFYKDNTLMSEFVLRDYRQISQKSIKSQISNYASKNGIELIFDKVIYIASEEDLKSSAHAKTVGDAVRTLTPLLNAENASFLTVYSTSKYQAVSGGLGGLLTDLVRTFLDNTKTSVLELSYKEELGSEELAQEIIKMIE